MKILRNVVLPLLLCALILALGFFAPRFYLHCAPDFTDNVQTVSIAGAESPLYIENTVEIVLPPWDQIDETHAASFPTLTQFNAQTANQIDATLLNVLRSFVPNPQLIQDTSFYDELRVSNELLFLRDFAVSTEEGDTYTVDFVYTNVGLPLYVHARELNRETAPAADAAALERDFETARENCLAYISDTDIGEIAAISSVLLDEMERSYPDTYVPTFMRVLLSLLYCQTEYDSYLDIEISNLWQSILQDMQDCYTLTYKDETLLVMTDSRNRPCTLFFDGASDRVTGFSIDAALLGYSASPTPLPSESIPAER